MISQTAPPDLHRVLARNLLIRGNSVLPVLAPMVYLVSLTTNLGRDEILLLLRTALIPIVLAVVLMPMWMGRWSIRQALAPESPDAAPGTRLGRLLELPRRLELQALGTSFLVSAVLAYVVCERFEKSTLRGMATMAIICLFASLTSGPTRMRMERLLLPQVVEEFHKNPTVQLDRGGLYWVRQSWHLPLSFAATVLSTVMTVAIIIGQQVHEVIERLGLTLADAGHPELEPVIKHWLRSALEQSFLPMALMGLCLCFITGLAAWQFVRHQRLGARALADTIESLASHRPHLPGWVSTDELGDVAFATASAFERLRQLALGLGRAAQTLRSSARELSESERTQSETRASQADALQHASITVSEIRSTSMTASARASAALKETEAADELGHKGEQAIEESLQRVEEIRGQVSAMINRMHVVDERARQIARITTVVKDLADQSNVLALNAAVEAARSGEHGKGFAVVAREIRTLADQSLQATSQVRRILDDISGAIREAAAMNEEGSESVDRSLHQLRASEQSIRQISAIVRSSAMLVRQISEAVEQQHVGVSQVTYAVLGLSRSTDADLAQLRASSAVTSRVSRAADEVYELVRSYGWSEEGRGPAGGDVPAPARRGDEG